VSRCWVESSTDPSVSPWSSVSRENRPVVVPPDTGALLAAGVKADAIVGLWERYYLACGQVEPVRAVSRGGESVGSSTGCLTPETVSTSSFSLQDGEALPPKVLGRCSTGLPGAEGVGHLPSDSKLGCSSSSEGSDGSSAGGCLLATGPVVEKKKRKRKRLRWRKRNKGGPSGEVIPSYTPLEVVPTPEDEGFGYLRGVREESWRDVASRCGAFPSLRRFLSMRPEWFLPVEQLSAIRVGLGDRCATFPSDASSQVTSLTTVIRSVPLEELRADWARLVKLRGVCMVPGVRSGGFKLS